MVTCKVYLSLGVDAADVLKTKSYCYGVDVEMKRRG